MKYFAPNIFFWHYISARTALEQHWLPHDVTHQPYPTLPYPTLPYPTLLQGEYNFIKEKKIIKGKAQKLSGSPRSQVFFFWGSMWSKYWRAERANIYFTYVCNIPPSYMLHAAYIMYCVYLLTKTNGLLILSVVLRYYMRTSSFILVLQKKHHTMKCANTGTTHTDIRRVDMRRTGIQYNT